MIEARAGNFAFSSRSVPHRYTVGDDGCRMLLIVTRAASRPRARGERAGAGRTLPPSDEELDWENVAAVAQAHGCELLG